MKIFLAGTDLIEKHPDELKKSKYQLASFYSLKKSMIKNLAECDEWLLDSGAFSFMNGKSECDFNGYLERYAEFVKEYDVKNYFELDLDTIIGVQKTEQMRNKLEKIVGRQCIPVWHKIRGIENWVRLSKEYKYIALGGVVTKEIAQSQYSAFPAMIEIAHKNGAKVHGLGFTATSYFNKIKFDSVDSTTWNVGGKFGNVCVFTPKKYMRQLYTKSRCINHDALMIHNWNEWIKFQKFAEKNL